MKSLEAKALQAYILREGLCHPDYIVEQKKYRRIFTLLKWKYRKIWRQIEAKIGMSLYRGLRSQNDCVMELLSELNWRAMTFHVAGISFFKCKPYYTWRFLNYR